jgi:8-oxo-dGTP diphosphatase
MLVRKNTGWLDGYYCLPAGKVEYFEHFTAGAAREAKEEAGVDVAQDDLKFVHLAHSHFQEESMFIDTVDVYFEAETWRGEPYNAEEQKSERLDWIDVNNLPENVVPSQKAALEHLAKNVAYSEFGWS